jgi:hypothetical protein
MTEYNFSITAEECRQLEEEQRIADILIRLQEAGMRVGFNTTIDDAINQLSTKTRYKSEVEEFLNKQFYPLTSQLTK